MSGIILIFILQTSTFAKDCQQGFSSFWEFNQKKETIRLKEVYPLKICTYIKKQIHANFRFILKKNNKVVFENKVYWAKEKNHESADKDGKMTGFSKKEIDHKIMKFPIPLQNVDSYEVKEINSGKKLGKGAVRLKK